MPDLCELDSMIDYTDFSSHLRDRGIEYSASIFLVVSKLREPRVNPGLDHNLCLLPSDAAEDLMSSIQLIMPGRMSDLQPRHDFPAFTLKRLISEISSS